MTAWLAIEQAGPSSTLQDAGRYGYLSRGVSPSGAFDSLLHAIANRLAGNAADAPAVEFVMRGDIWRVNADSCRVAIAGDFAVQIDSERAASWRAYTLRRGQRIAIGHAGRDTRGYLAVAGGLGVAPVLGSASTHARTAIGPLGGGVLKTGTNLPLNEARAPKGADMRFDPRAIPHDTGPIRVILGPQQHYFGQGAIDALLACDFELTTECDRMGFQLRGPEMGYRKDIPLISEGVALGSLQVLERGLFILNLVDRQTVGGYPKIATVISSDIRRFAQMRPGAKVRFAAVDVEEAHAIRARQLRLADELAAKFQPADPEDLASEYLLSHNLISGVVGFP